MNEITLKKIKECVDIINNSNILINECQRVINSQLIDLSSLLLSCDPELRSNLKLRISDDFLTFDYSPNKPLMF